LKGMVSNRKSKTSDANAGDLKHLVGRKIKCQNGLTIYFVPWFLDKLPIMPNKDLNFDSMLVRHGLNHTSIGRLFR
jgi:hypothetical protein